MKKIGFIDYYLDEWHANHYPSFIKELSQGGYNVTCAYGAVDSPNGLSNAEWSEMHGIPLKSSIEDVMAECDAAIVLSPDNPEQHPFLCDIPFRSGKPVYVDKTFAVNADTARTLFEIAEKHNTPCFFKLCSAFFFRTYIVYRYRYHLSLQRGTGILRHLFHTSN